jgi:hypothetical protein
MRGISGQTEKRESKQARGVGGRKIELLWQFPSIHYYDAVEAPMWRVLL